MTTIHFFLGVGQGKRSRRWLTKRMPEVLFHEAPDYLRTHSKEEMTRYAIDYVAQCVSNDTQYVLIAESQACPAVVAAVDTGSIALPRQLLLIQPLGLNPNALGDNAADRIRTVLRRSRLFWRDPQQSLRVPGNRWTAASLLWSYLRHMRRFKARWTDGSNLDIRQQLLQIAQRTKVSVYASEDDVLFPHDEIIADFPHPDIVHQITGNHLNRATNHGIQQLRAVLDLQGSTSKITTL